MCAAPTETRDARHRSLPRFGADAAAALAARSALIIGLGGTGCAAASALAAAGLRSLVINDFDRVDATNLARQTLYGDGDIGRRKVMVAAERLHQQNPSLPLEAIDQRLAGDALATHVAAADVVLDCTDNFSTRFAINRAAVATATALVSGSAIRWEGQVAVFGPDYTAGPCYACLYRDDDESLDDCSGAGVLASLPATIGALMASETIKLLSGTGSPAPLTLYDAEVGRFTQLSLDKNPACAVCT